MSRISTAQEKLKAAVAAIDMFTSADRSASVDPISLHLLRKFRLHLVDMLNSIEGQTIVNVVADSGMGRAIVDSWPRPVNTETDEELNAVVRKVSEADYAYRRAAK